MARVDLKSLKDCFLFNQMNAVEIDTVSALFQEKKLDFPNSKLYNSGGIKAFCVEIYIGHGVIREESMVESWKSKSTSYQTSISFPQSWLFVILKRLNLKISV